MQQSRFPFFFTEMKRMGLHWLFSILSTPPEPYGFTKNPPRTRRWVKNLFGFDFRFPTAWPSRQAGHNEYRRTSWHDRSTGWPLVWLGIRTSSDKYDLKAVLANKNSYYKIVTKSAGLSILTLYHELSDCPSW